MKLNTSRKISDGMWMVAEINGTRRTCIATNINLVKETCTLSVVDEDGNTVVRIPNESMVGLAQAKWDDIPEARRGDKDHFARLGYV